MPKAKIINRDEITDSDNERFWSKVDSDSNPDGCWEWTARLGKGYGRFRLGSRKILAHRFAWVVANHKEQQDPNKEICHNCDNRKCCNPLHIRQDTKSSNANDKKKNMNVFYSQKLTIEQVKEIKDLLNQGKLTGVEIAVKYGVSTPTISRIKTVKIWKEI